MIHLQLGFFQVGNIVEDAVKQGAAAFLANPFDLCTDPDHLAIPVLLTEFHLGYLMGGDDLQRLCHHLGGILPIDQFCRVPLGQLLVFFHRVAGHLRQPIGKILSFEDIGHFVDGNPAWDGIDNVLHLLIGVYKLSFQMPLFADIAVHPIEEPGIIRLGFHRAIQMDPPVFPTFVVPQTVGMPHGAPRHKNPLNQLPQPGQVFRVDTQKTGGPFHGVDVLVRVAHDLIKRGVVE